MKERWGFDYLPTTTLKTEVKTNVRETAIVKARMTCRVKKQICQVNFVRVKKKEWKKEKRDILIPEAHEISP